MINPVNPGPAGTTGPAGGSISGPSPEVVQAVLNAGTATIATAMQTALTSIQSGLDQLFASTTSAINTAASSVTNQINAVQTNVDLTGATAQASIQAQLGTVPVPTAGVGAAAFEGEIFQITQRMSPPYAADIFNYNAGQQPTVPQPGTCIRGNFANSTDAVAFQQSIQGQQPPAWCTPSGSVIATGPPAPPPVFGKNGTTGECPNGYQVYAQYVGSTLVSCGYNCKGDPLPSGGVVQGYPPDLQSAQQAVATLCQQSSQQQPQQPTVSYYGGCVNGVPTFWDSTDGVPAGVTGQVGPFVNPQQAQAAVSCQQAPQQGQGGTGSNGACCTTGPGSSKTNCLYIDLCDWTEFENALYNALCRVFKDPQCMCAFKDATQYEFEDCDPVYDQEISGWMGNVGNQLIIGTTADGLTQSADQMVS